MNGDLYRRRCCIGKDCTVILLGWTFEVDRCWYQDGRSCLECCIFGYPNERNNDLSKVISVCHASTILPFYNFIHRLFIY
ncbi:unnamed protein product [Rotaria sordida]|uniref:Uncharacterized protein n=1 Tax=Rotaria sordida TaxID=392033 RepID=A0A814TBI4_9BILA|nr:unnamed protein product [Rotaria sordida]CAF1628196.1 unnamed protein product [Rotaria sordida]